MTEPVSTAESLLSNQARASNAAGWISVRAHDVQTLLSTVRSLRSRLESAERELTRIGSDLPGHAFDAAGIPGFMLRRIYREFGDAITTFQRATGMRTGESRVTVNLELHDAERLLNMVEGALPVQESQSPSSNQGKTNG